ncbi:MAG: MoaD/ThiS family protein [Candidatus Caldarchaeum sp.]
MAVKIVYFGPLKSIVGVDEEFISIEKSKITMREIIEEISRRHGGQLKTMFIHGNGSNRGINIFVNGEHILEKRDLETVVEDQSEVSIVLVSQAAGG